MATGSLRIYNTLSRQKEVFTPLMGNMVNMYVCGVTTYDDCHLGHAMSYIVFDAIRRYLKFKGYQLKYVQNFTDIDDKIIARSQKLGISAEALCERYIASYFQDIDALNVDRADVYPRATGEIPEMIKTIQALMDKGHAYRAADGVYFRVSRFPEYGKLSRQKPAEMQSQGSEESKERPLDFALWKAAKPGEPFWPSPWGEGRPGWHIECSTMALKYLGETLDIHGGGQDLIFPHHENEIAQSESVTGKDFARFWMHNGLVQLGEEKMSKSRGNLISIKQALSQFGADALRLFVLSSHYRSPLTYSEETVKAAERGVERLREAASAKGGGSPAGLETDAFRRRFTEAMDDDFNTPQAISALFDLARETNRARERGQDVAKATDTLKDLAGLLGFTLKPPPQAFAAAEPFIELLVSLREELRGQGQWQWADRIRSGLAELGVTLEDTPGGTRWKGKVRRA
ncbi:MAG: cysteine--tRNA ligase [Chloroflexota bacterium]